MNIKLLILLCATTCIQHIQAETSYISAELDNGSNYSFVIDESSEISFDDNKLVVNEESATSFEIDNVKDFIFSNNGANEAQLLDESDHLKFVSLAGNLVQIEGLSCNDDVTIANQGGNNIGTYNANDDGVVEIVVPNEGGTYIISDGRHSVKVRRS